MSKFLHHHRRRVVITGIGAITPLGNNLESSWNNLFSDNWEEYKNVGITTLEQSIREQNLPFKIMEEELELISKLPCHVAAPVRNIDYDPRTARFVQFALHAGKEAAKHAKIYEWLELNEIDDDSNATPTQAIQQRRERSGTSLGIGLSSLRDIVSTSKGPIHRISPYFVPKILPNSAPSRLSIDLSLQGPNHAITTACAASSHAIIDAIRCIQMGDADIMFTGGSESCIDPFSISGFCRLRALSTSATKMVKDTPFHDFTFEKWKSIQQSSRPFDSNRDGFVMGEGGAILVLEELEHALYRQKHSPDLNINILGEIVGYGTTGDAFHVTSPEVNGRGAERAMNMALERAAISCVPHNDLSGIDWERHLNHIKNKVQYINAHATSTPIGDDIEARVIDKTFFTENDCTNRVDDLYVSSTKGATGHLLGAAGAIEAAYTIMTLSQHKIPQTQNLNKSDDDEDGLGNVHFQHVTQDRGTLEQKVDLAMSNSLGFGGTNASLVFASYDEEIDK